MDRVVFVNHLKTGSASSYRQAGLAKYLRKLGYHTSLLGRGSQDGNSASSRDENASAYDETFFWEEQIAGRALQNLLLLRRILREADIVHINRANPYTATLMGFERSSFGGALVVDMEDWDGYGGYSTYARKLGPRGWLLTGYERVFPRMGDAVVVVSQLLRSYMLGVGVPEEKVSIIHNGFDEDLFDPGIDGREARMEYGLGSSPVVMYSGALWSFEREQHEVTLEAFRRVCAQVPDARLLLTGRGDLELKKTIEKLNLEANVVATGFVPRSKMPHLMAAADVALHVISYHPFHRASSPVIIPEYMAMGKAIVAPSSGELPTLLADGSGLLVGGLDSSALAAGVVRLLKDASLRKELGTRAARRSRELYSYRVAAASLKKTYDSAVRSRSAG